MILLFFQDVIEDWIWLRYSSINFLLISVLSSLLFISLFHSMMPNLTLLSGCESNILHFFGWGWHPLVCKTNEPLLVYLNPCLPMYIFVQNTISGEIGVHNRSLEIIRSRSKSRTFVIRMWKATLLALPLPGKTIPSWWIPADKLDNGHRVSR